MNQLHSTTLEFIAGAHHKLNQLDSVNPISSAEGDLSDVVREGEPAPSEVVRAYEIVQDADSEADAQRAADSLGEVLAGTAYDPTDPESNHPSNK